MNPLSLIRPDRQADRVVPPSGHTAWLTSFTAGAMAFLAVFAMALSLAAGRLADRWSDALERTATVRLSAPEDQMDLQTKAVLEILSKTPGIASARAMTDDEQRALLEPWFGPDLPVDALPLPRLIEVTEAEALARVKPAVPVECTISEDVESADDWVPLTTIGHILRNCDQCSATSNPMDLGWQYVSSSLGLPIESHDKLRYRCRRKDLPVAVPAVKRVPLRLWVHRDSRNDDRYNIFAKISPPDNAELFLEIKHDGDGFFVEVTE